MGYKIIDIELADLLCDSSHFPTRQEHALVIRRQGKAIGFLLPEDVAGATDESALRRLLVAHRVTYETGNDLPDPPGSQRPLPDPPTVTAVICTRDRPERLERCLTSLRNVSIPENLPPGHLSILVVDNAPSDRRTETIVTKFPGVRYVRESQPGLDFARNRGWRDATGRLVAYLDDDVVVDRGWLRGLLEAYQAAPEAAAFTGLVLPLELETEAQLLFEKRGGFRKGFKRVVFGPEMPADPFHPTGAMKFGVGANMAFRRDVLETMGGFDEALDTGPPLPGGGDLDIFFRILRSGRELVYEPSYLVFHEHRRETAALRRQYYSWGLSFMAFLTKVYRTDSLSRSRVRKLIVWWLQYQTGLLLRGLKGRKEFRPDFVLAELVGGARGLCGEYGRSVRRIRRLRERP